MFPRVLIPAAAFLALCACGSDKSTSPAKAMPTRGLLAYWSFDQAGDVAPDLSGNGHDMKLVGASRTTGVSGSGLLLSGSIASYGRVDSVRGLGLDTFTLVAWFKAAPGGTAHQSLLSRESPTGSSCNYRLLLDGDPASGSEPYVNGDLSFASWSPKWYPSQELTAHWPVKDDSIHMVAALVSGAKVVVWEDGMEVLSSSLAAPPVKDAATPLFLGASAYNGISYPFKGMIDEVRIYGRVLDTAELDQLADP